MCHFVIARHDILHEWKLHYEKFVTHRFALLTISCQFSKCRYYFPFLFICLFRFLCIVSRFFFLHLSSLLNTIQVSLRMNRFTRFLSQHPGIFVFFIFPFIFCFFHFSIHIAVVWIAFNEIYFIDICNTHIECYCTYFIQKYAYFSLFSQKLNFLLSIVWIHSHLHMLWTISTTYQHRLIQ